MAVHVTNDVSRYCPVSIQVRESTEDSVRRRGGLEGDLHRNSSLVAALATLPLLPLHDDRLGGVDTTHVTIVCRVVEVFHVRMECALVVGVEVDCLWEPHLGVMDMHPVHGKLAGGLDTGNL